MTTFHIAGIQMPVSNTNENLSEMAARLQKLMKRFPYVQMVVFSELCAHGVSKLHAEAPDGPTEAAFRRMAAEHHVWLVPGSVYQQADGHIFNVAPVINPAGEIIARYRKAFPFKPFESGVASGDGVCVFDVPEVGRFGLSICFDKWFPETTRTMALMGAEIILQPTLTDTIDREIELTIARANAAMNQVYFFDINGIGDGGNGRSIIVGPAGDVIHQAGAGSEAMPVQVDLGRVRRERQTGLMGLGQTLKSYRDRAIDFEALQKGPAAQEYLQALGPLEKPNRG
jgi:predicted amidohydrolase